MADDIKTKPITPEYLSGYDRTFGPDRKPVRGRWVFRDGKLVDVNEAPPLESEQAIHANIMVDRFYEGAKATDGTDIGSRRKHRDYMKATGLAPADDFSPGYYDRLRREKERAIKKSRREALERAMYKIDKP